MHKLKINTNPSENDQFRGLERLLKSHFNNNNLKVMSLTTTNLLPPGENYCSEMMKVDVTIRKDDNDRTSKVLHLVAKTHIPCEKPIINWPQAFKKELFVYAELLPIYKEIEREAGINDKDLIDILPSYVGYINSLQSDSSEINEGSILLMENLKAKDYHTINKRIGFNVQQASKALACLARYHALGTVTKQKRASLFNRAMVHAHKNPFDPNARGQTIDPIRRLFQSCSRLTKYLTALETSLDDYNKLKNLRTLIPEEPWVTINHGDFHVNNIMFHIDDCGDIDDVKLVDFQTYFYSSPLMDLPMFLCLSLDKSCVDVDEFDKLLDVYYENFVKTLKRIDFDTACFTKNSFDFELKNQAKISFSRIAIVVLVSTFQLDKEIKVSRELLSGISESGSSNALENNMIDLVEIYEKRGWF